jgi:hypothetical protein
MLLNRNANSERPSTMKKHPICITSQVSDIAKSKRHPDFQTFDPADLELFDKGYPNLIFLDDKHPHNNNVDKWVVEAGNAVDPVYEMVWPTKVAIAYANTYPIDPGFKAEEIGKDFLKYMKYTEVTIETAQRLLKEFIPGEPTYYSGWKAPAALYILEYFLGSEQLAECIIERFSQFKTKEWNTKAKDYEHIRIALEVLGFLMFRMETNARKNIEQKINRLQASGDQNTLLAKHLKYLPDKAIDMPLDEYSSDNGPWFMTQLTVSKEVRWDDVEEYGVSYIDVRSLYLDGFEQFMDIDFSNFFSHQPTKRVLLEKFEHFGKIKHPSVVRFIISLGRYKSVAKQVQEWKEQHADYVDAVLPQFAKDPDVKKGLANLTGDVQPVKPVKNPMKATEAVLIELEKALPSAFPSQKKVTALVKKALQESRDIADADGNDWLEEYFVALWAEFPFKLKTTDEEYELLSNAYEELVVG